MGAIVTSLNLLLNCRSDYKFPPDTQAHSQTLLVYTSTLPLKTDSVYIITSAVALCLGAEYMGYM